MGERVGIVGLFNGAGVHVELVKAGFTLQGFDVDAAGYRSSKNRWYAGSSAAEAARVFAGDHLPAE